MPLIDETIVMDRSQTSSPDQTMTKDRDEKINVSSTSSNDKVAGSALLVEPQSTTDGDIFYFDISADSSPKSDHDEHDAMPSNNQPKNEDGDTHTTLHDDSNHSDRRSSYSKSRGGSHHRSFSELFQGSASISGPLPKQLQRDDTDNKEINYPRQQLTSSSSAASVLATEEGNDHTNAKVTSGKKHRRIYSGGVSNPPIAHRRVNSRGGVACINRDYAMANNTNLNQSYRSLQRLNELSSDGPKWFGTHNGSLSPSNFSRDADFSPGSLPCNEKSNEIDNGLSSIEPAAHWLDNMRRSPPVELANVEYVGAYDHATTQPPTSEKNMPHDPYNTNSNMNPQFTDTYPPPMPHTQSQYYYDPMRRNNFPTVHRPPPYQRPSYPKQTLQSYQRPHTGPTSAPSTYTNVIYSPYDNSRSVRNPYPNPYYPRDTSPNNWDAMSSSPLTLTSSSITQRYTSQQPNFRPTQMAAAHTAAKEATMGAPHHPLSTDVPRGQPIPTRDSSLRSVSTKELVMDKLHHPLASSTRRPTQNNTNIPMGFSNRTAPRGRPMPIRDGSTRSIASVESRIETDEPLFQKDGSRIICQPRPISTQPHYRISPQMFEESLQEHAISAESPNALTYNSIYEESLLSLPPSSVQQLKDSHGQTSSGKADPTNKHHKQLSSSIFKSFVTEISTDKRTNSIGSVRLDSSVFAGTEYAERPHRPAFRDKSPAPEPFMSSSSDLNHNNPLKIETPFPSNHQAAPIYENPHAKDEALRNSPRSPPETSPSASETKSNNVMTRKQIIGGTSKRQRRKCHVADCTNRVVQGGLCISHGAKRKKCGHPGCNKHVKKAGMCSTHGPARKRCEVEGCSKVSVQGGRCIAHGAKKKLCSVEKCAKQAILSGMCKKHHDQEREQNFHSSASSQYCIPVDGVNVTKENEGNSPDVSGVSGSFVSNGAVASSSHRRGLSIFQDMSTVDTIIGAPPSSNSEGNDESAVSHSTQQYASRSSMNSSKGKNHNRGLSIFSEDAVQDKIVRNGIY